MESHFLSWYPLSCLCSLNSALSHFISQPSCYWEWVGGSEPTMHRSLCQACEGWSFLMLRLRASSFLTARGVQPIAHGLHVAQGGYKCGPTQNCKFTFFCSSVFVSVCLFNVWPKTTLLLPVWPRDAKRLDTPGSLSTTSTPMVLIMTCIPHLCLT